MTRCTPVQQLGKLFEVQEVEGPVELPDLEISIWVMSSRCSRKVCRGSADLRGRELL